MALETPFNMIVVGMTGCGKTYYILDMLENDYPNHFDYIFLICPTYDWNRTYQGWKYKEDTKFFPIPCDQDYVDDFLRFIVDAFSGTNSLIILDDCASGQAVKNRTSELVKLAFSARQDLKYCCDTLTHIASYVRRRPIPTAVCLILYAICAIMFAVGLVMFIIGGTLLAVYTDPLINDEQRTSNNAKRTRRKCDKRIRTA